MGAGAEGGTQVANHHSRVLLWGAALGEFLERTGMPTDPANITAEHIREFLIDQQERTSPETARLRRTYLGVFFSWLVMEGEIKINPVSSVEPPAGPCSIGTGREWEIFPVRGGADGGFAATSAKHQPFPPNAA